MYFSYFYLSLLAIEEEEPTKKSKKKKKKKVAAGSKDSKQRSTASSSSSGGDLSMAILGGSSDRNSMQVFTYSSEEGHSVVGMTEAVMMEMGLFEGDTVSIKGKRGKKTMASVAILSDVDVSTLSDGSSEGAAIGECDCR